MNPQKKQLLIVGVLGLLLTGVLGYQLTAGTDPGVADNLSTDMSALKKAPPATSSAASKTPAPPSGLLAGTTDKADEMMDIATLLRDIKEVDFDYPAEKMPRDVMAPLVLATTNTGPGGGEGPPDLRDPRGRSIVMIIMDQVVSGILWDPVRPLAVVDDEVVYPGYEYKYGNDIVVVKSIEPDSVAFEFDDLLIRVELKADLKGNL